MLGWEMLSTLTMLTLGLSAPTKVFAIALLVLATVSLDMKVLLAKELFAQITAMIEELVGQRRSWLPRLLELTPPLGMP